MLLPRRVLAQGPKHEEASQKSARAKEKKMAGYGEINLNFAQRGAQGGVGVVHCVRHLKVPHLPSISS